MNRIHLFPLFVLSIYLLLACNGFDQQSEQPPLEPGEKVGETAVVTTSSPTPHLKKYCEDEELSDGSCQIPRIGHISIANYWREDTVDELDAAWENSNWELEVDGRKVNLSSFFDVTEEFEEGAFRIWSIGLQSPTPGEHSVQWTYDIAGEHIEESWNFSVASTAFDE